MQGGLKQLTWKFFASSCNAYQLDVFVHPLSHSATRLLKVRLAWHPLSLCRSVGLAQQLGGRDRA